MNKLWLKISVVAALVLVVITLAYVFWPAETHIQNDDNRDLEIQPNTSHPEAEKLYQPALLHKPGSSPEPGFRIMVDCCRKILQEYPNSPQAERAKQLLQEVPEQYRKQFEREMSLRYASKPAVRKSRPLRRRPLRRDDEWPIATNDETNSSN